MNLMGMSFRGFTWKNNPTALTVSDGRNVKETTLPYAGTRAEDLGRQKRRVAGEGYFAGEDCWEQWNALRQVYSKGGPGSLRLPGQEPFLAVMDGLKLIGAAGKDLIKYAFSFLEVKSAGEYDGAGVHRAKAGETLWDHAWRYGRAVEELVRTNPDIRDIAALKEGEEVRIP